MSEALLFPEMELETPSLVAPVEQASQLRAIRGDYITEFISTQEEQTLLDKIDAEPWLNDLQRRVQHYGYRYDYKSRRINDEDHIGALPSWVDEIIDRLMVKNIFKERPDQMIVNEYEPGQGIAPHTDRDCFGPTLASLSLGSACIMHLQHDKDSKFDAVLETRSLIIFNGVSRYDWKHSITPRQSDKVENISYPRTRRVSLTFRTVIL